MSMLQTDYVLRRMIGSNTWALQLSVCALKEAHLAASASTGISWKIQCNDFLMHRSAGNTAFTKSFRV